MKQLYTKREKKYIEKSYELIDNHYDRLLVSTWIGKHYTESLVDIVIVNSVEFEFLIISIAVNIEGTVQYSVD